MKKNKMCSKYAIYLNVISITLLFLLGKGQVLASATPEQFHTVQNQIEQLIINGEIPSLSVAVARDGKIIWEEGFGLADKEKNILATEHTKYILASISKQLTATGLMILVERGLVNLDKPINEYLGTAKLNACIGDPKNATVRRVACHTSGLPLHSQHFYDNEPIQPSPMDETIRRYGNLVTAPGERYQYSNLGYGLLGHVISRASGKNYADFMREEVFIPLGMDRSSVYLGKGRENGQAVNYASDGSMVPLYLSDSPGAESIVSSADLIRFGMFHLKNDLPDQKSIIKKATIDQMQIPNPATGPLEAWECDGSGYGIGWVISTTKDNLRAVRHDGGTVGVSTTLTLVPEENIAIAILSNTKTQWRGAILIGILRTLLPEKLKDFPAPADQTEKKSHSNFDKGLAGLWEGRIQTFEKEIPLVLDIKASGSVFATMGDQPQTILKDVSYSDLPSQVLMNVNGGFLLRGVIHGKLETADVNRGKPYKLWLELKLRENVLNGSLIAFSQRKFYTGPLTHWVEMKRK